MKRTPLKRRVEKVMEFHARGRAAGGLRRSEGLKRGKTRPGPSNSGDRPGMPPGPLDPGTWRAVVLAYSDGYCVSCGAGPFYVWQDLWTWQAHHPVPKQHLPPEKKYDPRNGVALCAYCHRQHEAGLRDGRPWRVPGEKLPARVWSFAEELGTWAVELVNRLHPPSQREEAS